MYVYAFEVKRKPMKKASGMLFKSDQENLSSFSVKSFFSFASFFAFKDKA